MYNHFVKINKSYTGVPSSISTPFYRQIVNRYTPLLSKSRREMDTHLRK